MSSSLINWFKSYLSDRSQSVNIEGNISKVLPLNVGVRQCAKASSRENIVSSIDSIVLEIPMIANSTCFPNYCCPHQANNLKSQVNPNPNH